MLQSGVCVHFDIATPGGLQEDRKVNNSKGVQRFGFFGYRMWKDGTVMLDVSSGAGAQVYRKDGRGEVVLGAGSLACSYRAECVAMEACLKRVADTIELSKARETKVAAFAVSLLLLVALNAGPAAVEDAVLPQILGLITHIARLRVSVNFQFVFSRCGAPRSEAADKAAEQGTQSRT
ncbi:hypothetical protein ERJ75_001572500 [Trypanosoma vivax]|nr:hypothetical protein ERJ75_001572500 [Trypanosoma vivax]